MLWHAYFTISNVRTESDASIHITTSRVCSDRKIHCLRIWCVCILVKRLFEINIGGEMTDYKNYWVQIFDSWQNSHSGWPAPQLLVLPECYSSSWRHHTDFNRVVFNDHSITHTCCRYNYLRSFATIFSHMWGVGSVLFNNFRKLSTLFVAIGYVSLCI